MKILWENMQRGWYHKQFQPGFRSLHSTQSTLIKITKDRMAPDIGWLATLILLNLSVVVNTIFHILLLNRLVTTDINHTPLFFQAAISSGFSPGPPPFYPHFLNNWQYLLLHGWHPPLPHLHTQFYPPTLPPKAWFSSNYEVILTLLPSCVPELHSSHWSKPFPYSHKPIVSSFQLTTLFPLFFPCFIV